MRSRLGGVHVGPSIGGGVGVGEPKCVLRHLVALARGGTRSACTPTTRGASPSTATSPATSPRCGAVAARSPSARTPPCHVRRARPRGVRVAPARAPRASCRARTAAWWRQRSTPVATRSAFHGGFNFKRIRDGQVADRDQASVLARPKGCGVDAVRGMSHMCWTGRRWAHRSWIAPHPGAHLT